MPKLVTLLKILRDGMKKGFVFQQDSGDLKSIVSMLRDHYERLEVFWQKRYPKEKRQFVDGNITQLAISATRNSGLGILDTITREFITFWLPNVEAFMEGDFECNEKACYEKLVAGIEDQVIKAANRVDCARDESAIVLRKALIQLAVSTLTGSFNACESLLDNDEKARYDPKKHITWEDKPQSSKLDTSTKPIETISEARLLNSAVAWDVVDRPEAVPSTASPIPKPMVKRGFAEAFSYDGVDPADNGAIWGTPQDTKRQKFEVKIAKVVSISDSEDDSEDQIADTSRPRRILEPVSRSIKNKKRVSKGTIKNTNSIDAQVDVQIPGALKTSDENCILM